MKRIACSYLLGVLLLTANAVAQDAPKPRRLIPIGNLELLGSYSDIDKGGEMWGYNISGSFSPAIRLNDTHHLLPLYNGSFKRMRQYVTQEEGGRLSNKWQLHNGSLALRSKLSEEWTSRVTGLATWNLVKETRDESFGTGLYDYRDLGGSLDLRHTASPDEERKYSQAIGLQYFRREYPNYQSLISLATQTAIEKNEKDFNAIKFSTGLEARKRQGLNWELRPSLLLKYFVDKRLIDEGGVLDMNKKRRDYVLSLAASGFYPVKNNWQFGLDNSIDYNHSNLGFYDSRDTAADASDDVFTKDYYTYLSVLLHPSVTYYYRFTETQTITIRAGYSLLLRDYAKRKVQDSDGTYTGREQMDTEHGLHLKTIFPITKGMDWVINFDYTIAGSNQNYEKYYRYEYNVYQVQSGISISF